MKLYNNLAVSIAGIMITAGSAIAAAPINISITPNMALHHRSEHIEGLVIGLWNENPQRALALGIVNGSTGHSKGLSWAMVLNYADDYTGIHWAPINYTKGDFTGWQGGAVNYVGATMEGLQTGFVNCANNLNGLQVGAVNYARSVDTGLQLGFINLMPKNEWFSGLPNELAPGMVFINWHF